MIRSDCSFAKDLILNTTFRPMGLLHSTQHSNEDDHHHNGSQQADHNAHSIPGDRHKSVCLSVCLSVYLSICLSGWLSVSWSHIIRMMPPQLEMLVRSSGSLFLLNPTTPHSTPMKMTTTTMAASEQITMPTAYLETDIRCSTIT